MARKVSGMPLKKVTIAIMGVTGSGKSTFIQVASELDVDVGHNLKSCTASVEPYTFEYEGYEITLVDTPGFNDTFESEHQVLKNIASWLELNYRNPPHTKLTGIIYMHAITDRRMYGSSLRNLVMFRELCGDDPLKNVILVTTGWGAAAKSGRLEQAAEKERELRTEPRFWANMIKNGSRVKKFQDTRDSALEIILSLVDRDPAVLQIQRELVDEEKDLVDTAAGCVVNEEMKKMEEKYDAELRALAGQIEEAQEQHDQQLQDVLLQSKQELEILREEARMAQEALNYERRQQARDRDQTLQDIRNEIARREKESNARVEKLQQDHIQSLEAQRIASELRLEGIIQRMRDNEQKIRKEERDFLEAKIAELRRDGSDDAGGWLTGVAKVLGAVAMGALGFFL